MRKRVLINSLFLILMILVAGCSKDKEDPVEPAPDNGTHEFDYTTTVTELISRPVSASLGATLEVTDVKSSLNGLVLDIPSGALPSDMTVKIGTVNNPPALPAGEQYIGTSIDLGPDGTVMNKPLGIQIPYTDCALSDAGISDDTALRLYAYDKAARAWEEVSIQSIDRNNNILYAEIYHSATMQFPVSAAHRRRISAHLNLATSSTNSPMADGDRAMWAFTQAKEHIPEMDWLLMK
jgi:hypothetical protein